VRIFAVTHQGFLMEFHNLVKVLHGGQAVFRAAAKNCSLHEFAIEYPITEKEYSLEKVKIECKVDNFVEHWNPPL